MISKQTEKIIIEWARERTFEGTPNFTYAQFKNFINSITASGDECSIFESELLNKALDKILILEEMLLNTRKEE